MQNNLDIIAWLLNPIKASKYLLKQDDLLTSDFISRLRELFADCEEYKYFPKNMQDWQEICAEMLSGNMFCAKKICYIFFDDYTEVSKGFIEKLIKIEDDNIILIFLYQKESSKVAKIDGVFKILAVDIEKSFVKWAMMKIELSKVKFEDNALKTLLAEITSPADMIQTLERLKQEDMPISQDKLKFVLENADLTHFAKKLIYDLSKSNKQVIRKDEILLELRRQNIPISTLIWYLLNELKKNPDNVELLVKLYDINLESRIYDEDYVFLKLRLLVNLINNS